MHKLLLAIIGLTTGLYAYADGPNYQVFPQLNALSVNYHVEAKRKQTTVYATNHEKFLIVCDAFMNTNRQEKTKGRETLVEPGKTIVFSFPHGSSITDVRIYLMCESRKDTAANDATTTDPDTSQSGHSAPKAIIEQDLGNL